MEERFSAFTLLISKIQRQIRRIKTEEMAEYDLKSPHVSCLYYLYKWENLTAAELSEACDEDKGAISRSLEHLERCGYLACDAPAGRRYKARLSLTESGREVAAHLVERIDSVLDVVGRELSDEKRAILYECLAIVSNDLEEITRGYAKSKRTKTGN